MDSQPVAANTTAIRPMRIKLRFTILEFARLSNENLRLLARIFNQSTFSFAEKGINDQNRRSNGDAHIRHIESRPMVAGGMEI